MGSQSDLRSRAESFAQVSLHFLTQISAHKIRTAGLSFTHVICAPPTAMTALK